MVSNDPVKRWRLEDALQKQRDRSHTAGQASPTTSSGSTRRDHLGRGMEGAADLASNVTKFVSPTAILDAVREGFKAYRGYKMLAFGAQSVGKTTMWTYLETGKAGAKVEKTVKATAVGGAKNDPMIRLRSIRGAGIVRTGIRAYDIPGDPQYRKIWRQVLSDTRPEIIVFMVDHDEGSKDVEGAGYTVERMAEHEQAYEDLQTALFADPEMARGIRAFMILANKHDVWHGKLPYGTLLQHANVYEMSARLVGIMPSASIRYSFCSALTGDNLTELLRVLLKEAL